MTTISSDSCWDTPPLTRRRHSVFMRVSACINTSLCNLHKTKHAHCLSYSICLKIYPRVQTLQKKEQHLFNAVLNHVLDLIIDTVGGNSISFNSAILASFSLLINMSKSREKRQETLSLKVKYHILILEYSHIF